MQFIVLGIYKRNDEETGGFPIVFDVIVDGEVIQTCRKKNTALLRLADELDKKVGT